MVALLDSVSTNSSTQTLTCVLPGGAPASGDLLVVTSGRTSADSPVLAGFTAVTAPPLINGWRLRFLYRVCDGTETDTFVFDYVNGTSSNRITLSRWSGSWGSNPLDVEANSNVGATATQSLTPATAASALLVSGILNYQLNSGAPAAGNTELSDAQIVASNAQLWMGYRIVPTTSGSYTLGATLSGGGFQDAEIQAISFIESAGGGSSSRSQAIIIG